MKELVVFSAEDQSCIKMDLRATHHATLRRDMFVIYHNGDFCEVKMENKNVSHIAGIGDVHLES